MCDRRTKYDCGRFALFVHVQGAGNGMRPQHGRRPIHEKFHDRPTEPDEAPCSEIHGGYKELTEENVKLLQKIEAGKTDIQNGFHRTFIHPIDLFF